MDDLTREDLDLLKGLLEDALITLVERFAVYIACYSDVGDDEASEILQQARALLGEEE